MIACYAWTNMQIINIVNEYSHTYTDEPADLFVLMLDRISGELLSTIRAIGIFKTVYCVPVTPSQDSNRWYSSVPVIRGIFATLEKRHFYERYYTNLPGKKSYDLILTHGYWGEFLH